MAIYDAQQAWVNLSGMNIPVYDSLTNEHGSIGAGGNQIGVIVPNEFYTTRIRGNNLSYHEVRFRDGATSSMKSGYIDTLPEGFGRDEAPWAQYQYPYHLWASNGSALESSGIFNFPDNPMRLFRVKKPVECMNRNGGNRYTLAAGTLLLTDQSTTGSSNPGYMLFKKYSVTGGDTLGRWHDFNPNDGGYAFVDLGLNQYGSMPGSRAIW